MDEKRNVLSECKEELQQAKEIILEHERQCIEYKNRVGEEELGIHHANRESTLHSQQKGVPIIKDKPEPRKMIRMMEKKLGISSWIDNF